MVRRPGAVIVPNEFAADWLSKRYRIDPPVVVRNCPPIAAFITDHPVLEPVLRASLTPSVAAIALAVNATTGEKAVLSGLAVLGSVAAAVYVARRRRKSPEHISG